MNQNFTFHELENSESGVVTVDGAEIQTFTYTITGPNILSVTVGTTGLMGGDSGHGGRTYLKLEDHGGTDLQIRDSDASNFEDTSSVEIRLGGDAELDSTISLLEYAVKVLKSQVDRESGL